MSKFGNTPVTRALVRLLHVRFDPALDGDREQAAREALAELRSARESIATSAEDRIFAGLENTICATLRANFSSSPNQGVHEIAFKLEPARVVGMPAPVPFAEIFVHSAEMSGVHLRGESTRGRRRLRGRRSRRNRRPPPAKPRPSRPADG